MNSEYYNIEQRLEELNKLTFTEAESLLDNDVELNTIILLDKLILEV